MDEHLKVINEMKECTKCDLHKNRTQVVVGDYGPKNGICFIGEAPGYHEDKQGRPFVGKSGELLDKMLKFIGLSREKVSVLNINKCRPPSNRKPTKQEMDICGNWLDEQISYLEPKILVSLGSTALEYLHPGRRMTPSKGKIISSIYSIPLYPLFHPAYVLRGGESNEEYKEDFSKLNRIIQNTEIRSQSSDSKTNQVGLDEFF